MAETEKKFRKKNSTGIAFLGGGGAGESLKIPKILHLIDFTAI